MNQLLIENCRLLDANDNRSAASLLIENGLIARIEKPGVLRDIGAVVQAEGRILCLGFIDVHIQGAGGADILDGTEQALEAIARTSARFGATAYLGTTVFKPGQPNRHLALAARRVGRDLGGAALLGIHLEEPFISPEKRGMIQPDCICQPDLDVLKTIYELCGAHLRMMTCPYTGPGSWVERCLAKTNMRFRKGSGIYERTTSVGIMCRPVPGPIRPGPGHGPR